MILVLGFALMENQQEKAKEFLAVDMVRAASPVAPPRKIELRESFPDFRRLAEHGANIRLKPQTFRAPDAKSARQLRSSDMKAIIPELTTDADQFSSRFDAPIPGPEVGVQIAKPGASSGRPVAERPGASSAILPRGAGIFESALYWIARNVISNNKTGREDIVFLIDASGTMEENIAAVARYLSRMIDVFKESKLDYTMGVIKFNRVLKNNDIKVYQQTRDVNQVKFILRSIKCDGDENALDAIEVGLGQVEFRRPVDKTFILVTDEGFKPRTLTEKTRRNLEREKLLQEDFQEVVRMCQSNGVKVSVLGIDNEMHKSLAKKTGGLWFQIPKQDEQPDSRLEYGSRLIEE